MRRLLKTKTGWVRDSLSERSSLFWTVVVSAAALLIVAVLQYRWTMQVNEAAEMRIGTNLQSVMVDWHLNFFHEFSAICVALQVGPDSGAEDHWDAYVGRYANWSRVATKADGVENISVDADLVQSIYIWETSREADARLFRLTGTNIGLDGSEVPGHLRMLLTRLQANSSNISVALRAWQADGSASSLVSTRSGPMTGWQFDPRIPAIVHPIIHHPLPHDNAARHIPNAIDWIVVVFDRNTIEKTILPAARQYFGDQQQLDYKVAVLGQETKPSLLYSSDPEFGAEDIGVADATMNIFGPPPESTEDYFWQTLKKGGAIRTGEWRNFSAPVWFPVIRYRGETESWILAVRHRQDATEEIVSRMRRRNLAINAAVCLLLAVSMGSIVIGGHQSKKLVKLQMDFVASVSHELRTPLAVICSAAENIVDGVVDGKGRLTQYGSVIMNQGRQLTTLVDQILLFASTREGGTRFVLRPLQVSQVLQRAINNTSGLVERAGVTVELRVEETLPPVMGDLAALS
ncbi:MAG TPA: histidine kinase dimerization/phospho-acceptor domain-containing protein, partial [Terriglobales bacterium]